MKHRNNDDDMKQPLNDLDAADDDSVQDQTLSRGTNKVEAGLDDNDDEEQQPLRVKRKKKKKKHSTAHDESLINSHASFDQKQQYYDVRRMAADETLRIRLWRGVVALTLILAAVAITLLTSLLIRQSQQLDAQKAFEQFSETIADSAMQQQLSIQTGFRNMANILTTTAAASNNSWPLYTLPLLESYAQNFFSQSPAEMMIVFPKITGPQSAEWEAYASQKYAQWVTEGHLIKYGNTHSLDTNVANYHDVIYPPIDESNVTELFPAWTVSPPPSNYEFINWDLMSYAGYSPAVTALLQLQNYTILSAILSDDDPVLAAFDLLQADEEDSLFHTEPHSLVLQPVHQMVNNDTSEIVAILGGTFQWDNAFADLLPEGVHGLLIDLANNCQQSYTFEVSGARSINLGTTSQYTNISAAGKILKLSVNLTLSNDPTFIATDGHCQYTMLIYPNAEFIALYENKLPLTFALTVSFTFVFVLAGFYMYDVFVNRRNEKLVDLVVRSNAIVTSIFPGKYGNELIAGKKNEIKKSSATPSTLKSFVSDSYGGMFNSKNDTISLSASKPMADLFLETTIIFADVVGFTAWSSVREPSQVFSLLETIYSAFDEIAKHRRVFKVETVGDCYVAVAGLPDPRPKHAVVMARFARDILNKMHETTSELEVTHGPDTADLTLRIGLHSGPVTAGVLRGERARFQLFGDTMNTTARIESNGKPDRIHVSQETADLLTAAGKGSWLTKREDKVIAKGKGELQTYWLSNSGLSKSATEGSSSVGESTNLEIMDDFETAQAAARQERINRLIGWNVETLLSLLKQVVARRNAQMSSSGDRSIDSVVLIDEFTPMTDGCFMDEVREIIMLPEFDRKAARRQQDYSSITISPVVVEQLFNYVSCVANLYRDNPFHNFEHASHVLMSVVKLMSRIVAPTDVTIALDGSPDDGVNKVNTKQQKTATAATLHDHTYGITSDPLTQFACAFSALIHDVDHLGVPNTQLVKEELPIARVYNNRSVAEQNSLELSWDLLMDSTFTELRRTIYSTQEELIRFRQLVVNSVMATDIVDKDLKALRNARWDRAFKTVEMLQEQACGSKSLVPNDTDERSSSSNDQEAIQYREETNRKATIVIEHLIQASDVSHTMQHWHIYRKWNERFFMECYEAYLSGRAASDPSEGWYKGEIGFFDFYIIPLAKKLKDCGVFGISSDEYLTYAKQNRKEWEARGQEVVAEMLSNATKALSVRSKEESKECSNDTKNSSRRHEVVKMPSTVFEQKLPALIE